MTDLLRGRAGLVTGAAGGIGRASALALAREGASLVVADLDEEGGRETVRLIEAEGGEALFVRCDVSRAADAQSLAARTVEAFGRLDLAHNNAGVGEGGAFTADTDEAHFDRVIAVNLKGVWLSMKYELPEMVARGGGAIVNTASVAGLVGAPGISAYSASKHGVVGLTKSAALEYAEQGIRINAVCPAATHTAMWEQIDPDRREDLLALQAQRRVADPAEIGAAVVWLCSDLSSYVTGAAIPVDGGLSAQ
jgi:NAD(P)-dependent dehydrogenase (short-subunit alcohol dehydrogenase family)